MVTSPGLAAHNRFKRRRPSGFTPTRRSEPLGGAVSTWTHSQLAARLSEVGLNMSASDQRPSISSPAAEAWQVEFARMLPDLERLLNTQLPPWSLKVLRSSQLDAQRLDAELHTMLQEQFMSIFKLFQPGQVSSLAPELSTLLALLVYWLSIWQGRATPGSELMNLRYRNERAMDQAAAAAAREVCTTPANPAVDVQAEGRQLTAAAAAEKGGQQQTYQNPPWLHGGHSGIEGPGLSQQQKLGYAFAFVAMPYFWVRLHRYAVQRDWGQDPSDRWSSLTWRALRGADAAHKLGMVLNSWVFLYQGKYRTLVERLLGARLVYKQSNMSRLISFEYLNRQLVWQELSEFLLFLLPLINVSKVKRLVMQFLPRMVTDTDGSSSNRAQGMLQQYPRAEAVKPMVVAGDAGGVNHDGAEAMAASNSNSQQLEGGGVSRHVSDSPNDKSTLIESLKPIGPCPICGVSEMLVPFVAHPCRHIFCYYCLQSHCGADQGYQCPLDGVRVDAMQRYVRKL